VAVETSRFRRAHRGVAPRVRGRARRARGRAVRLPGDGRTRPAAVAWRTSGRGRRGCSTIRPRATDETVPRAPGRDLWESKRLLGRSHGCGRLRVQRGRRSRAERRNPRRGVEDDVRRAHREADSSAPVCRSRPSAWGSTTRGSSTGRTRVGSVHEFLASRGITLPGPPGGGGPVRSAGHRERETGSRTRRNEVADSEVASRHHWRPRVSSGARL
jgi:hypothetical protein